MSSIRCNQCCNPFALAFHDMVFLSPVNLVLNTDVILMANIERCFHKFQLATHFLLSQNPLILLSRWERLWSLDESSYWDSDFRPRTFLQDSPQSRSVNQAVGSDNCYESNFYLNIALLSPIQTSIYTKNVFSSNNRARVLINVVIMQCLIHFLHLDKKNFINPASS